MQGYGPPFPINPNMLLGGRYRLLRPLGRGTFGQVFEAEDVKFVPPKRVALKLLHQEYLNNDQVRDDIRREAGVLARFNHPNILRVIDFEVTRDLAYIVTDLAEGGSLANKIGPDQNQQPRHLTLEQVARYLEQIAEALDEAHAQGLVHRDIKPLNILLDKRDRPLLADFGLAANLSGTQSSMLLDASSSGTPLYMSPEQWRGQAGKASDIYALGVLVYQLVTGRTPYEGNQFELMGQHLNSPVPPLSYRAPGLVYPAALDTVVAATLAKDQHQRIRPASEFARRFRAAIIEPPQPRPAVAPTALVTELPSDPEIFKPEPVAPAYAKTQFVVVPPRQNPLPPNQPVYSQPQRDGQLQPPFNQTVFAQPPNPNLQPPPNQTVLAQPQPYQYNPNYSAPGPSPAPYRTPAPIPRKNYAGLYIGIGVGVLVLLLIVVLVATNNPVIHGTPTPVINSNVGNATPFIYPGANQLNVVPAVAADCVQEVTAALGANPAGVGCTFYATRDSNTKVIQFYQNTAQSRRLTAQQFTIGNNPNCLDITNGNSGFEMVIFPPTSASTIFGPSANGLTIFTIVN